MEAVAVTNSLALLTNVKSVKAYTAGAGVIKHFIVLINSRYIHPSIIFVIQANSLPDIVYHSMGRAISLRSEYWTRMEVTDSD